MPGGMPRGMPGGMHGGMEEETPQPMRRRPRMPHPHMMHDEEEGMPQMPHPAMMRGGQAGGMTGIFVADLANIVVPFLRQGFPVIARDCGN